MTREEYKKDLTSFAVWATNPTNEPDEIIEKAKELGDRIFNDFKSRVCENCEHKGQTHCCMLHGFNDLFNPNIQSCKDFKRKDLS